MGRHSAPDDYDDDAPAVLSNPPAATGRPTPGRHSGDTAERPRPAALSGGDDDVATAGPVGLDVIETAMGGVAADDLASGRDVEPAAAERTEQIEPIVDPVLDEPLPAAVTTIIPPVGDGPRPAPHPQPSAEPPPAPAPADSAVTGSAPDAEAEKADKAAAKARKAEAKAADKAADRARKAEAKARGAEAKAGKAEAKAGKAEAKSPDARVSDIALLRSDSAARARVIAAVVVPFLVYVIVLLALDEFDLRTVLIWIWVPLISAGVVAGLLLDLAHRGAAARAIAALEPRESEPTESEPRESEPTDLA